MTDIGENLLTLLLAVLVVGFMVFLVKEINDIPTVYTSHATGACVKIELSDGSTVGCENLKSFERYENVWVK